MYRVILPDGELTCESYEHTEQGVEVYTNTGTMAAFVPYTNLVAIINTDVELADERAIM